MLVFGLCFGFLTFFNFARLLRWGGSSTWHAGHEVLQYIPAAHVRDRPKPTDLNDFGSLSHSFKHENGAAPKVGRKRKSCIWDFAEKKRLVWCIFCTAEVSACHSDPVSHHCR